MTTPPAHPVLYSFRRCPYAMRARMALAKAGVACVLREVVLRRKPAAMLEASPKGTVPVLVLPDGRVLAESLEIMRWALAKSDPEGWLAGDDQAGQALLDENDREFKVRLDQYKYFERHPGKTQLEYRAEGVEFLRRWDEKIRAHGGSLTPGGVRLVDIALFPFVRQFAGVDREWFDGSGLDGLVAWLRGFLEGPLFKQVMAKVPEWDPEQEAREGPRYLRFAPEVDLSTRAP